jgi:hypothetical protein
MQKRSFLAPTQFLATSIYLRSVRQTVSNYTRYARLLSCFWVLHHGGSFSFCERVQVHFAISTHLHAVSQTPYWVQDSPFSDSPRNGQFMSSSVAVAF